MIKFGKNPGIIVLVQDAGVYNESGVRDEHRD